MEPHIVVRMEPHIVVTILLDYNNSTIKDWTTGRCLNKQIKNIIDTKQYEKGAYGRRTFLKMTAVIFACQTELVKLNNMHCHIYFLVQKKTLEFVIPFCFCYRN